MDSVRRIARMHSLPDHLAAALVAERGADEAAAIAAALNQRAPMTVRAGILRSISEQPTDTISPSLTDASSWALSVGAGTGLPQGMALIGAVLRAGQFPLGLAPGDRGVELHVVQLGRRQQVDEARAVVAEQVAADQTGVLRAAVHVAAGDGALAAGVVVVVDGQRERHVVAGAARQAGAAEALHAPPAVVEVADAGGLEADLLDRALPDVPDVVQPGVDVELEQQAVAGFPGTLILVTHDVSVVAEMCRRTAVMYAGVIAEIGATRDVLARPHHPYTMGLLNAFPTLESAKGELVSIPGAPPDLAGELRGCRFAERCPFVTGRCREEVPPLVEAADTGPFFHNNAVETLEGAVAFYNGQAFNNSPSGRFLASIDSSGVGIRLDATQVVAVAAFLRVVNALENIRQSIELLEQCIQANPNSPHNLDNLVVTLDGRPIAELRPVIGPALSAGTLLHRWRALPKVDVAKFRADIDRGIDPSL